MKVLSTDGLTKLIQLIKSAFISVDDTVSTNSVTLADVATSGSYNDLTDKPIIPPSAVVDDSLSTTSENPVQNKVITNALENKANKSDLSTVATSGSYNDLFDKPTIPSAVTESTVLGWGFTKNTGTVTSVNNAQPDSSGNVTISVSGGANTDLSNLTSTGNNLVNTALNTRDNTTRLKFWTGTKAQYDAISTKDSNTLYNITDDQDVTLSLLQTIYPVGSVYLSTNATCPLASLFGTWTLVSSGRALWTGTGSNGGSTIEAGLPNITGYVTVNMCTYSTENGALYRTDGSGVSIKNPSWGSAQHSPLMYIDASRSNSIYGNSTTVQPPAYVVNVWRRTA